MHTFIYSLSFSPYVNRIKAQNLKKAREHLDRMWSEYNLDNVLSFLAYA